MKNLKNKISIQQFHQMYAVRTSARYTLTSLVFLFVGTLLQLLFGGYWWILILAASLFSNLSAGPLLHLLRCILVGIDTEK